MIGGTLGRPSRSSQIVELYRGPCGPVQTRGSRIDCTGHGLGWKLEASYDSAQVLLQESPNGHAWSTVPHRRTCRFVRVVVQSTHPIPDLTVRLTLS